MRHYWQPAALTEELSDDRPVKAVTLMGEDLVLYRNADNEYGLIGRACPTGCGFMFWQIRRRWTALRVSRLVI